MPGLSKFVNHSGEVRVVVAGDSGTGKTNLVNAASIHQVPETLASNYDGVPITIIDTSSRTEDSAIVDEQLKQADSVILTYALDRPETFQNLTTFWFPRLRQLQVPIYPFLAMEWKEPLLYNICIYACLVDIIDRYILTSSLGQSSSYSGLCYLDWLSAPSGAYAVFASQAGEPRTGYVTTNAAVLRD
ncbi:hypothetical protein TSUD_238350 [Trifolium subterraneum]|uniref:Miro domain-containing protein n=1 Tax=Trifolium subterraneum TaxID=3900 RepID=A0A2Z6NXC1_TRISU|nr:hypothetical protein TSUD_238350 [Trifolium subterraneum]